MFRLINDSLDDLTGMTAQDRAALVNADRTPTPQEQDSAIVALLQPAAPPPSLPAWDCEVPF